MKHYLFLIIFLLFSLTSKTQDSSAFKRITESIKEYKIDTSDVPNDKITKKIIELRSLNGVFNISEAIDFKIQEDLQKAGSSKENLVKLSENFKTGLAKKWLDNAITWIYRQEFSYQELKQLVKFYKTSTGQKMATDFPIIMLKSLTAAEMIQKKIIQK